MCKANFCKTAYNVIMSIYEELKSTLAYEATTMTKVAKLLKEKGFKKEDLKGLALVTNFKKIIETSKTIEDCCKDMYDTLTSNKKAPFAVNLLYLEQFKELKTPAYIQEGLVWLKSKLNAKH